MESSLEAWYKDVEFTETTDISKNAANQTEKSELLANQLESQFVISLFEHNINLSISWTLQGIIISITSRLDTVV